MHLNTRVAKIEKTVRF